MSTKIVTPADRDDVRDLARAVYVLLQAVEDLTSGFATKQQRAGITYDMSEKVRATLERLSR